MGLSPKKENLNSSFDSTSKAEERVLPERGNWDNKLEYLLSSVGYAVGLGNVWRFPYLCYQNGGGAFLLPYILVLFLCGLPIFLIETSLGQFSSQGPVRAFNGIPILKGLGFSMLCVSLFVAPYYNIILSWTIFYLYNAGKALTGEKLPWEECKESWGPSCYGREKAANCSMYMNSTLKGYNMELFNSSCDKYFERQMAVEKFWEIECLGSFIKPSYDDAMSTTAEHVIDPTPLGPIQWHLALTLFISWLIIGFSILKGVKSSGKTMYVTATLPYVILTILLVRGLMLDGAIDGIKYFIKPVPSRLKEAKIWKDAVSQIFYSLSVSWGGLLTLSSYNPFRNNLYRDTFIVVCTNSATSIYAGFAIFSYLGYMAKSLGMNVEDIVNDGPGLAFQVWPEAMTQISETPWICGLFAILFFLMLYSLGVSTMIVTVETITTSLLDIFPILRQKRKQIVAGIITTLFLLGLPMVTQNGIYWFTIMDTYAASYSLIVSATLEMLAVSYIYGIDRMGSDIKMMTSKVLPVLFKHLWSYVTPAILLVTLAMSIVNFETNTSTFYGEKFKFHYKTHFLAMILVFMPIIIIIGIAVRELKNNNWNFKAACKPTSHWGPLADVDRIMWNKERTDDIVYRTHSEVATGVPLEPMDSNLEKKLLT